MIWPCKFIESFRIPDSEIPEFRVFLSFRFRIPDSGKLKFWFRFRISDSGIWKTSFRFRIPDSGKWKIWFRFRILDSGFSENGILYNYDTDQK